MLPTLARPARRLTVAAALLLGFCHVGARAATLEISGPAGASVRLGGQDLGLLPLGGPLELAPGLYQVECRARGYHDLSEVVLLSEPTSWLHLRLRPLPLERRHAIGASLLFAGLGQWYTGARVRGWVYFLGESGGLLTALAGELQRKNHRADYLNYLDRYEQALLAADIALWRGRADQAYQDMRDMTALRDTGLYVAAGAWLASLLDAWLLFPGVDIGPGLVPPVAHAAPPAVGLHAGLAFGF